MACMGRRKQKGFSCREGALALLLPCSCLAPDLRRNHLHNKAGHVSAHLHVNIIDDDSREELPWTTPNVNRYVHGYWAWWIKIPLPQISLVCIYIPYVCCRH